ncbi:fatty-acid--CoA ligase [Williamsia muralis]|uniref:fatty-acid--CoA ligase n=1 Tax=Williamsia marianensis TaxID=85044 RepID=UPI003F17EE00
MTQHSRILASDFSLPSDEGIVDVLSANNESLAKLGAHHMVVYSGLHDPRRVFATLGLHDRGSIDKLLRNPAVMDWFDAAGVEEIPPLFAGEVVEKIDLVDEPTDHTGIIVAAIAPIDNVDVLLAKVRGSLRRFIAAGVRRVWIYRAFDDRNEVMILQELDTEEHAIAWVEQPDAAAEWMSGAGVGVYPPLFVGKLQRILELQLQA